jgi:hypothetical protein
MAHIAYERLDRHLQGLSAMSGKPGFRESATAMLDAWSIVDSAHRMRDLVEHLPGLPNSKWKRLLQDRTGEVAELRNCVQHQLGEIENLISNGGQLWGFLSWAEFRNGRHTGKWRMMAAGSTYVGDQWLFAGPNTLPLNVPPGRVRLNAFGREIYLGRVMDAMIDAGVALEKDIADGTLRPKGLPAVERRGADAFHESVMLVVLKNDKD